MRSVRTMPRARGIVTGVSVIAAMAILIRGEAGTSASAADMHASVSNRNITVTVTPSKAPEDVPANKGAASKGAAPAGPAANPSPSAAGDAWFGKQKAKRPQSVDDVWDLPHGEDISTEVLDYGEYPYRAIVHIDSTVGQCTGGLYGPDVVITAGHCVFKGKWASSVKVIAARPPVAASQFPECHATALFTTEGWKSGEDETYDYGAIRLDCSVGSKAGWLGYGWTSSPAPVKTRLTVAGYRSEYVFETGMTRRVMRWSPGEVMAFVNPFLFFDNSTQPMTSGAPILAGDPADGRIIGVHAQGCHQGTTQNCDMKDPSPHGRLNHGTSITRDVFQNMQAWRSVAVP